MKELNSKFRELTLAALIKSVENKKNFIICTVKQNIKFIYNAELDAWIITIEEIK